MDKCDNPFTDFMYSVRQTVALWRADHKFWKTRSFESFCPCRAIEKKDKVSDAYWRGRTDAEIIEATVEMLSAAAENRMGYKGSWSRKRRDNTLWLPDESSMFRFDGRYAQTAF
jgi:hypothetical protein